MWVSGRKIARTTKESLQNQTVSRKHAGSGVATRVGKTASLCVRDMAPIRDILGAMAGGIFKKAMVIGLDGATYDLLVPWMREGRLPHLRRLYDTGARGGLHTVIPPATPAAWSTFMT